jgi:hypothetical protein
MATVTGQLAQTDSLRGEKFTCDHTLLAFAVTTAAGEPLDVFVDFHLVDGGVVEPIAWMAGNDPCTGAYDIDGTGVTLELDAVEPWRVQGHFEAEFAGEFSSLPMIAEFDVMLVPFEATGKT